MGLVDTRRRAERLDCTLPVRVKGVGRPVTGATVNLSRVGVLLRIARTELEIAENASTADVAREVNRSLGDVVVVDLHYELLGALVRKGLRVVRVAVAEQDTSYVELGCDFSSPLSPEQISFLGMELPEPSPELHGPEEQEPEAPLCVYVSAGSDATTAVPILASVSEVEDDGIVARVDDPRSLPVLPHRDDPGAILEAITEAFGGDVRLLLVHGTQPLWAGSGRILGASRAAGRNGYELHVGLDASGPAAARARLHPGRSRPAEAVEAVDEVEPVEP